MKLTMHINMSQRAQLVAELSSFDEMNALRDYLNNQGIANDMPGPTEKPSPEPTSEEVKAAAEKPKTAATKETKKAAKEEPAKKPAPAADTVKTVAGLTLDDVTAVLSEVVEKFGVPEALAGLKRFGVQKAGQLDKAQYADFIEFANHCVTDNVKPTEAHENKNEDDDGMAGLV
jgi:hypothetical protein